MERSIRLAECLAMAMVSLDRQHWPSIVERAQNTLSLTDGDGTIALEGDSLVLQWSKARHAIPLATQAAA